jgi:thymidine kinase
MSTNHSNTDSNMTISQNSTSQCQPENVQQHKESGRLTLFVGPMYSVKTSKLIKIYSDAIKCDQNVTVLTHSSEIRYSVDQLSTHDQTKISCFKYDKIKTFIQDKQDDISKTHVILIDEAQFFDDLLEIKHLVDSLHKNVYIFGLDGDFKRNKFGQILDLIPYCDSIEKLTAICSQCNNPAIFSCRIINNDQQVLVGSSEVYQPMCRNCYNSK